MTFLFCVVVVAPGPSSRVCRLVQPAATPPPPPRPARPMTHTHLCTLIDHLWCCRRGWRCKRLCVNVQLCSFVPVMMWREREKKETFRRNFRLQIRLVRSGRTMCPHLFEQNPVLILLSVSYVGCDKQLCNHNNNNGG